MDRADQIRAIRG